MVWDEAPHGKGDYPTIRIAEGWLRRAFRASQTLNRKERVMRKLLFAVCLAAVAVAAVPSVAQSARITSSRSTSVTGTLTSGTATFATSTLVITCTGHRAVATTRTIRRGDASGDTSIEIDSGAGNDYTVCTYTVPFLAGGRATVRTSCRWVLTAATTTTGTVTIPAACTVIDLSGGAADRARITIDAQSVALTAAVRTAPTALTITVADRTVRATCVGCPLGITSVTATQTETLTIATIGLSS
jgi:hypothetical protein